MMKKLGVILSVMICVWLSVLGLGFLAHADEEDLEFYGDDGSTVIVYSFDGLNAALQNGAVDTIHMGADITLTSQILISVNGRTSPDLVIDGTNPKEEDGHRYTLTEESRETTVISRNIYLNTVGTNTVLSDIYIQNIDVYGYNYFGTIQVSSDAVSEGYSFHWKNVSYNGSQPIYAPKSTIYLEDSEFVLRIGANVGELGEAKHFVIDGNVRIDKQRVGDENEIFFIRESGGGIRINENGVLSVDNATSLGSGLYYACSYLDVQPGGALYYTGFERISGNDTLLDYISFGEASRVVFRIKGELKESAASGPLKANNIYVEKNSMVHLLALENSVANYPLLYSNYLVVNEPESMMVINNGFNASGMFPVRVLQSLNLSTDEIRHWSVPVNEYADLLTGGVGEHRGTLNWYNRDGSLFSVSGSNASWNFSGYTQTDSTSPESSFSLNGIGTVIYQKLLGLIYEKGDADSGEPPENESIYRMRTNVDVLDNTGNLQKNGYSFLCWRDKESGERYYPGDKLALLTDMVLIPEFVPARYEVSFDSGLEYVDNPADIMVQYGALYGGLPELAVVGFRFLGWYTQPQGGELITPESIVSIAASHTLYARWQEVYRMEIRHINKEKKELGNTTIIEQLGGGQQIWLQPKEIDNYRGSYYRLAGTDDKIDLDVPYTVVGDQVIEIVYSSTILDVSLPETVQFVSLSTNEGKITSADYKIENRSDIPIAVKVEQLLPVAGEMDGITLVKNAQAINEMHLDMVTKGRGESNGFSNDLYNIEPNASLGAELGVLAGAVEQGGSRSDVGNFGLAGRYIGPYYGAARKPRVNFMFKIDFLAEGGND